MWIIRAQQAGQSDTGQVIVSLTSEQIKLTMIPGFSRANYEFTIDCLALVILLILSTETVKQQVTPCYQLLLHCVSR